MNTTIVWRRLDTEGHEVARLRACSVGWEVVGTAVFTFEGQPCRLEYCIVCDRQWRTTQARVTGWIGEADVTVSIVADEERRWWLGGTQQPAVAGCHDLDLNFSPVTNTLPIRRLGLAVGERAAVRAAWLRFPSFQLEPLEQHYARLDANTYRYESAGGSFVADLAVRDDGLVTRYPQLWQAVTPSGAD